jgi:hypothetical protein
MNIGFVAEPGARFTITHRSTGGTIFAPSAFVSTIGQVMPLKVADLEVAAVRLVDADVSDDGTSAELTFETVAL